MPVDEPFTDVVVVIPGITGSVLKRKGKEVWAPKPGAALRAIFSRGSSIAALKLDGDDPEAEDLGDHVVATELVPDLHVLPGLKWKIDGYGHLRSELIQRLDLEAGKNYFELPYDWRRDNRVAAGKLARQSKGWLKAWRDDGHGDAKLVLVGHSMGGIVARIFLELMDGWRDTSTLVTFGTPYSGSVNALEFLAGGFRKEWGPVTVDLSDTIRSFTSVYQLLPSYRCMTGPGDPAYLDQVGVVPGLPMAAMTEALTLQRGLRKAVDDHRKTNYEGTGGYDIRPILGDFQVTKSSAKVVAGRVEISTLRSGEDERGDGTVPKVSAIPHEFLKDWLNASYRKEKHGSLQNNDSVIDQLCGALRASEIDTRDVFPAADVGVQLEAEDVLIDEPVVITAMAAAPDLKPKLSVRNLETDKTRGVRMKRDPERPGGYMAELKGWPSGDYRVTVGGPGINPTSDLFSIVDPNDEVDG